MSRHALPRERAGRHRFGRADRVYCRELPAAREYYAVHSRPRRWYDLFRATRARHSLAWLRKTGQQARPAFALIMSL